jgi:outer membrane protein
MEMDPSTPITVEKPDISKLTDVRTLYTETEVIKTAFAANPDIRLAELQQQTYAQAIKVAKGNFYPALVFFGNLQSSYANVVKNKLIGETAPAYLPIGTVQGTNQVVQSINQQQLPIYSNSYPFYQQFVDNFNQSFGFSMQIPIFNRLQAHTTLQKAKLNYQNAQLATELAKNTLSKTIIQALQDLSSAQKSYQSSLQTFNSNKEALNITKQRYDAGLVNTLDYNTAVTNYDKSQNDLIEAQYQVVFRAKVIDYYMGNPIVL